MKESMLNDRRDYGPRGHGEGEGRLIMGHVIFISVLLAFTIGFTWWLNSEYATVIRWQDEAWKAWSSYSISVWPGDWVTENPLAVLWGIGGVKEGVASTLAGWVVSVVLTAITRRK